MNTEQLLICAKRLGYKSYLSQGKVWITVGKGAYTDDVIYNPLTNDAQAMELLKWLIDRNFILRRKLIDDGFYWVRDIHPHGIEAKGQTLNEAIISAVCAMEGEG